MKTPYHEESRLGSGGLMRMLALVLLVSLFAPTARAQVAEQDSLALVALYNSTEGLNWSYNDNWLTGPVPTWFGIEVENNRVIGISLNQNKLNGIIPPELIDLSELRILNLDGNLLNGSIPPGLGSLSALTQLVLSSNQLTGSIPPELGNLSSMEFLYLFGNTLTGSIPPELGNLTQLKVLNLNGNELSGSIPSELGNLSMLTGLGLSANQLSGSIPPELGMLSKLETLAISDTRISGSIPPELANLNELQRLSLVNNQLSGSIPSELGDLSRLIGLDLSENQLTGSIPPELGNLSELRGLNLFLNQLSGSIPSELGNLSQLGTLNLNSNELSGSIPPELGNLSKLIQLNLSANQLSGSIPPELGMLSNLEVLWIFNNQFSGIVPAELGDLTNLNSLWLGGSQLTGSLPMSFINLTNLTFFIISGTSLCEPNDPAFQQWLRSVGSNGTGIKCDPDESTPPECELVEVVKNSHIKVRVQDTESGLQNVTVTKHKNSIVTVDSFVVGSTDPIFVTAVKINPNKNAVLELDVFDVVGNHTRCDPVLTTLTAEVPSTFSLEDNYPNPFNPSTTIRFQIAEPSHVTLIVYDVMGRTVARLVDQEMSAGSYAAEWDGRSDAGAVVAGGIYFYRIEAGSFVETRSMSLVK